MPMTAERPNGPVFSGPTLPRLVVARRLPGVGGQLGSRRRDTARMHETHYTTSEIYKERRRVRWNTLLGVD